MGVSGDWLAAGRDCGPNLPDGVFQPLMEAYLYPKGTLVDSECAIGAHKKEDAPVYPLTIIPTRYGGAYEGGRWAAFALNPQNIPDDATGSDPEAQKFWYSGAANVGRGDTPSAAVDDLLKRLWLLV